MLGDFLKGSVLILAIRLNSDVNCILLLCLYGMFSPIFSNITELSSCIPLCTLPLEGSYSKRRNC